VIHMAESTKRKRSGYTSKRKSRSWAHWFKAQMTYLRSSDAKKGLNFDLSAANCITVLVAQNGRCALTNARLTHQTGDMLSASVDKKDDNKGYSTKNIRLVCAWVKTLKSQSNCSAEQVVDKIKNSIAKDAEDFSIKSEISEEIKTVFGGSPDKFKLYVEKPHNLNESDE